jgi:hypothetical protein
MTIALHWGWFVGSWVLLVALILIWVTAAKKGREEE